MRIEKGLALPLKCLSLMKVKIFTPNLKEVYRNTKGDLILIDRTWL